MEAKSNQSPPEPNERIQGLKPSIRDEIAIRERKSEDDPFIYSSWLRCFRRSGYFAKHIPHAVFMEAHHDRIEEALKRGMTVWMATPKKYPDTILGYLAWEAFGDQSTIHFIFVKEGFQGLGIATLLFEKLKQRNLPISFTHWTRPVDSLMHQYPEMIYDPYRFF